MFTLLTHPLTANLDRSWRGDTGTWVWRNSDRLIATVWLTDRRPSVHKPLLLHSCAATCYLLAASLANAILVAAHSGAISARSCVTKATTFYPDLPARRYHIHASYRPYEMQRDDHSTALFLLFLSSTSAHVSAIQLINSRLHMRTNCHGIRTNRRKSHKQRSKHWTW